MLSLKLVLKILGIVCTLLHLLRLKFILLTLALDLLRLSDLSCDSLALISLSSFLLLHLILMSVLQRFNKLLCC